MNDEIEPVAAPEPPALLLGNKTYDVVKFIALIALPAVGALYFGLAAIWGLPKSEEVVGSITVFDTFLGALLKFSTKSYNRSDAKYDGVLPVVQTPDGPRLTGDLQLTNVEDPHELVNKKEVIFKVQK